MEDVDAIDEYFRKRNPANLEELLAGNEQARDNLIAYTDSNIKIVVEQLNAFWNDAKTYVGVEPEIDLKELDKMSPQELIEHINNIPDEFYFLNLTDSQESLADTKIFLEELESLELLKKTHSLSLSIVNKNPESQQEFMDMIEQHFKNSYPRNVFIKGIESILVQPPAIDTTLLSIHQIEGEIGIRSIENFNEKYPVTKKLMLENVGEKFEMPSDTGLTHLMNRNSHLTKIPESILSNVALESLDLGYNEIRTIPEGLEYLNLHKLDLSSNDIKKIKHLPFPTLNELNLSNNDIHEISPQMVQYITCGKFYGISQELDISGNNLNLKSIENESLKMAIDVLGAEKTYQLFFEKQTPPFPENKEEQMLYLEKMADKNKEKVSVKL